MLPHTDGKPWERHACLAVNIMGGGGFEIWQHILSSSLLFKHPYIHSKVGDIPFPRFSKIANTNADLLDTGYIFSI